MSDLQYIKIALFMLKYKLHLALEGKDFCSPGLWRYKICDSCQDKTGCTSLITCEGISDVPLYPGDNL